MLIRKIMMEGGSCGAHERIAHVGREANTGRYV